MSTVAFDGRYFAADTQVTSYTVSHGFSKMKVLKNRKVSLMTFDAIDQ